MNNLGPQLYMLMAGIMALLSVNTYIKYKKNTEGTRASIKILSVPLIYVILLFMLFKGPLC